jgi:hypothetical protein
VSKTLEIAQNRPQSPEGGLNFKNREKVPHVFQIKLYQQWIKIFKFSIGQAGALADKHHL